MKLKGQKILITGGLGFIGSNLSEKLSKDNDIVIIDDLSTGNSNNLNLTMNEKNIEFIKGSITDLELMKKITKDIDIIFHQAALPNVKRSIENPILTNKVNVEGTLNLLKAAADSNVKKFIYASSSSVYGNTKTLPKKESMKPEPISPYAVQKLTGEYYCNVFQEVYGLKTVSLRYFNVYGPRQNFRTKNPPVIINFIIKMMNDQPIEVYGDGNQTRDFTYVRDVVDANILAAEKNVSGVFNIGYGENHSINELIEIISRNLNKKPKVIYKPPREGDVRDSLADITKANREMGYKPKFDLESGIKETIRWVIENVQETYTKNRKK